MAVAASKAALRKDILHKVASISTEERSRQSEIIQNAVISSKSFKEAKHISVYLSLPKEVSTKRIVDAILADSKKRLYVPDILHGDEESRMEMLEVLGQEDLSHFEEKELHVRCPTHDIKRANPIDEKGEGLDMIIMPGVAFTKEGARMGRGKGYYDRYLHRVREYHKRIEKPMPRLVALAFDEQVLEEIPVTDTDEHLDLVVYPMAPIATH